ncbi:FAD-binding protein [bacterium]|nr:MAG: FAD-binding protein [bacterium]
MERTQVHEADVLIIGAGGAGLRAAIAAKEAGARVAVVCKSLLGKAHTVMAEGGIAASLGNVDARDDWKTHFKDTMFGGKYVNDWRAAELHAKEAAAEVIQLERWGALFDRTDDGKILQRRFGGHTYPRLAHVGDRTGLELIRTLEDTAVSKKVDVYMEYTITRLVIDNGRVVGAVGYKRDNGETVAFRAPAVIIATGGAGKIYTVNSNSWEGTGDGQVLALRAGAELSDMEFVQFHPTGMVWPLSVRGILVTEAVRGEGGLLTNSKGERFMQRYDPERMELSTRDVVARAIFTEVREGRGSPHGGAFLAINHKPANFVRQKLPSMYTQFMAFADVDITKEPMEVFPTTHYAMGGIRVDAETCATRIPGLYAAGEAATGLHGANRLGGNSLSDLLVFGRRAGVSAVAYANANQAGPLTDEAIAAAEQEMNAPLQRQSGETAFEVLEELGSLMMEEVGVFRTAESLGRAKERLAALRERARNVRASGTRTYNPGWHAAIQIEGMVALAQAIAASALMRTESRGAHTRVDYPKYDDNLQRVNTVSHDDGSGLHVEFRERAPLPEHLAELIEKVPA